VDPGQLVDNKEVSLSRGWDADRMRGTRAAASLLPGTTSPVACHDGQHTRQQTLHPTSETQPPKHATRNTKRHDGQSSEFRLAAGHRQSRGLF
jgi:hypothetical protein